MQTHAEHVDVGQAQAAVAYEGWPVTDLKRRAKELGLSGYSGLSKDKLIDKLRSH